MLTPKRLAAALRDSPPKTTASTTRLRRSSESALNRAPHGPEKSPEGRVRASARERPAGPASAPNRSISGSSMHPSFEHSAGIIGADPRAGHASHDQLVFTAAFEPAKKQIEAVQKTAQTLHGGSRGSAANDRRASSSRRRSLGRSTRLRLCSAGMSRARNRAGS